MADEVTLSGLNFEIEANSQSSIESLNKLTNTLNKLTNLEGLSEVSAKLKNLSETLEGMQTDNLSKFADALGKLGSVGRVTISSTIPTRIRDINNAISQITNDGIENLNKLSDSLYNLGKVGNVKIPKVETEQEKVKPVKLDDIVRLRLMTVVRVTNFMN